MAYGGKPGNMRKRAARRRPTTKGAKKGLTKTEKKQVTTIAKRAVTSVAESKYFNVNGGIENYIAVPAWQSNGVNSEVSCWGFTTGLRRNAENSGIYKWGIDPANGNAVSMTSLNLNYLFRDTATPESRQQYSLEGLTCRPSYNEVKWLIERPQSNTITDETTAVPYKIRMLRLVPRALKASYQEIDPKNDCFLDAVNEPFGPSSLSATGTPVLNLREFHLAKANSRRYRVIADTTFTMLPSSVRTDIFDPGPDANNSPIVTQPSTSGCKVMTTKHNIGKELHWQTPNDTASAFSQYPDNGFEPEFVLFLVGALGGVGAGALTDNIRISARPVSTFKDM
jgi:hypothetical protein